MSSINLIDESRRIDSELVSYENSVIADKERTSTRLAEVNIEFIKASEDGDRSENAAFEQALRDIAELNADLNSAESQLSAIERCREGAAQYKHGTMITDYSTVYIKKVGNDGGKVLQDVEDEYIFKLFPYGISQLESGIMSSSDSIVGIQMIGKKVGDEVKVKSRTTGAVAIYKIEEFY